MPDSSSELKRKVEDELRSIENFLNSPMFRQLFGDSKQLEIRLMFNWLTDLEAAVRMYRLQDTERDRVVSEQKEKIKLLESKIKDMERFSYLMV